MDSLHATDNWENNLSHKKLQYNHSKKIFTGRTKPTSITGDPDKQCPDNWSSTAYYSLVQISSVLEAESTPAP